MVVESGIESVKREVSFLLTGISDHDIVLIDIKVKLCHPIQCDERFLDGSMLSGVLYSKKTNMSYEEYVATLFICEM